MKEKKRKAKEIIENENYGLNLVIIAADSSLPNDIRLRAVEKAITLGGRGVREKIIKLIKDKTQPKDLRLDVAKKLAKELGRLYWELAELAYDKTLPKDVREVVINELIAKTKEIIEHQHKDRLCDRLYSGLAHIIKAINSGALPEDARMRVKGELQKVSKKIIEEEYWTRAPIWDYYLVENISFLPKEVILVLIERIKEHGEFDKLIIVAKDKNLSEDILSDAKNKIGEAAKIQIERCIDEGFYFGLLKISKDERLDESVRELAKSKLVNTAKTAIKRCIERGKYFELLDLSKDKNLHEDVRLFAKNNLLNTAKRMIEEWRIYGFEELFKLAEQSNLPENMRKLAKKKGHQLWEDHMEQESM